MPDMTATKIEREAYLEALLATLPEIIAIVDRDLRILEINQAGLKMIGVSSLEELLEDPPVSLISNDDLPRFREEVNRTIEGDVQAIGDVFQMEIKPLTGPPQLHECRIAPLKDSEGHIVAAIVSGRDVSSWRDALDEADRASSILQSILTTVPDAMVVIDEKGLITSFSKTAETLFGYTESEILGKNVSMLMPTPFREKHDGYISAYLKTGKKNIIGKGREVQAQRKDHSLFPIQLEVGEAVSGTQRLFTGFIHDLSDRRETEEQVRLMQSELMHASRLSAIGTLASSLAHELNQPLTAITNYLSAGRDMLDDLTSETAKALGEALDESTTESVRAGKIVQRLREFVAKGEVRLEILSMAELVNDATTLGLIDARVKGVDYNFDIHPDINHVLADKVQIQQVMVNLMRNAIEAMEDSPVKKLTVAAHSAPDNRVEFVVRDTGPGISPEVSDRLFQPFATTKGDGMGLGLSICKTIIEAHGGELTAEAASDGGAIFRFTLQKAPQEQTNAE